MIKAIQRRSPVQFDAKPLFTEMRNSWKIVLSYQDEKDGPFLVDLSHMTRWDIQDGKLDSILPVGIEIPETPGECRLKNGILINRMNRTQAAIWHLDQNAHDMPVESCYTDVTEATVFLALFGHNTFSITEKLTSLDFGNPGIKPPSLLQGPFCNVPSQIVLMEKKDNVSGAILLTCQRGYAHGIVSAIMDAGEEFGLRPAGESRFLGFLADGTSVLAS